MSRQCLFLLISLLSLAACQQPARVRVAVAANAQYVAQVLKQEFEKETGIGLELIVNSSGKITTQVEQGAPYDVFLSADTRYPQALYAKKLTLGPPRVYGYGKLILWAGEAVDLERPLPEIVRTTTGKIAMANPETAPYGQAAQQVLAFYGLQQAAQNRLVLGESVSQVNQYLLSGAAGLGFTARSAVLEPAFQGKGHWKEVDAGAYAPIAQSAVLLRTGQAAKKQQAARFFEFLFSVKAQAIFKRHGYVPVAPEL